tara:strand:+ start:9 stop:275 length:267 start_codon:yes stop_codon:yes gene_type:complete
MPKYSIPTNREFDPKNTSMELFPEVILFILAHNGHEFALEDDGGAQMDHLEDWKDGSLTVHGDKNHKRIDTSEWKEIYPKDIIADSKK